MKRLGSCSEDGFSMIEVLITLVILAFGLLGLAGMQSVGLKNSHSSLMRSKAVVIGYDIIDRMRSNCMKALDGDYNIALATAASSTPSTMAQRDLAEWKTSIAATLNSGQGAVTVNAATFFATVTIQWDDSRATSGSATQTVTVVGVLPAPATCQPT